MAKRRRKRSFEQLERDHEIRRELRNMAQMHTGCGRVRSFLEILEQPTCPRPSCRAQQEIVGPKKESAEMLWRELNS
jgi:hypothetical protein